MKIKLMHSDRGMGEAWRAIARVQHRLPGVETTKVEVYMATYSLFATDHRHRLPTNFDHSGGWGCFR